MKRVLLLCAVLALTCGATYATDYVWSAGAVSAAYDCATAYTPNISPALSSADRLIMDNNAGGLSAIMNAFPGSGTITLGAIEIDCGLMDFSNTNATMRLVAGNGQNGDLTVRYSGRWGGYGGNKTFDVDGNVYFQKGPGAGWTDYTTYYSSLVMRGTGKTLDMDMSAEQDGWKNVTVYDCASVSAVRSPRARNLFINGTITGGTWTVDDFRGDSSVQFGPSGQMTGGELVMLHLGGTGTYNSTLGGGTYPALTIYDSSGGSNTVKRIIRLKGDVTVTNDFSYDLSYGGYITHSEAVLDTDNGSGKISNLTVNGNLRIGRDAGWNVGAAGWAYESGIFANSSTVTVKGDATFDRYAYIKGGTSTWKFGGNVLFTSLYHFDNSDLKTTKIVLNGSGAQSVTIGDQAPIGDIELDSAGGAISLGADVVLNGNFKVNVGNTGTFNNNGHYVVFAGKQVTEATAQQIDARGADLGMVRIMDPPILPSYAILMSDLAVSDNLDIDAGCKLFLNGFTLDLTGSDAALYLGRNVLSGEGTWTVAEGGQIIGAGAVPEPATLLLLGTGALGVLGYVRRRRLT